MRFPRLKLMSSLLRRSSRTHVSSPDSIATTIDAALRSAGLIREPEVTTRVDASVDASRAIESAAGASAASSPLPMDRDAPVRLPPPVSAPAKRAATPVVVSEAATPIRTGFFAAELDTDFGRRPFKLFVPSSLPRTPCPLLVMLHGCTQDPDDFATGTRMNQLAEEQGFILLYPMQRSSDNPSRCWNWFRPADQRADGGEPGLLAELTRHVMREYPVDGDRVYVAGLSAGAAMAAILVREFPDLYAAAGMHSGLAAGAARDVASALAAMHGRATPPPPAMDQRSATPVIVFHGDSDRTVVPSNAQHIIATHRLGSASTRRGASGRDYTVTTYASDKTHAAGESWLIQGAGHAWSGGDARGSHTDARGPDASREMLRFFLANPKRRVD
jgi:poly(hydroxyalkanoate) depolymerase family esterase